MSFIGMVIPAFVNPDGGGAEAALAALDQAGGFAVRQTGAGELPALLSQEVAAGTPRVLVAGGDGTLARAAAVLAGTPVALAVLPGGTLNHFARDHGIPLDPARALALAATGPVGTVDVGYVNDDLFLNTSSVGAYTRYVRTRERLEPILGYWLGSLVAGLRVLFTLRPMTVVLAAEDATRACAAPLVFVGVGERKLGLPGLGQPAPDGGRGLHVVMPRDRRQARRFARAFSRLAQGRPPGARAFGLDTALVERFRLRLSGRSAQVALDGEIKRISTPLDYRLAPGALRLVAPPKSNPVVS
jgi:diacylglycerol kinase family enzyme